LPGRIDSATAKARLERLIAAQDSISGEILDSLAGQRMGILVEGLSARRRSQLSGKCGRNISVNFTGGDERLIGQIVQVNITDRGSNTLRGEYGKESNP
jgi:tRNA-2-methylthio-N6-dimethylallyladenosine synthase